MKLGDLCTIHTGYTARSRLEPAIHKGVLALQLRDISAQGAIDPERLMRVQLDHLPERFFVNSGDVVFRSKGDRNTATALDERFTEPVLALLPLMVLRPKRDIVTPEYLAWAINQPQAQRQFDMTARGTNLRMIPRSSLDDLELDIPDIKAQKKILTIDRLAEREWELARLAADRRRKMMSLILAERADGTRIQIRTRRTPK